MDGRTESFSPSILSSSRNLLILWDFNCHHPLWDSRGTSDPRGEEVVDWVISSDLLHLNDPDTHTLLHCSTGSRSSLDISFAPSSFALSCSWEMLQDLGSDHLPILVTVPLSPVFRLNERPPSFNFQKACWDGFASYFDSHCRSDKDRQAYISASRRASSVITKAKAGAWQTTCSSLSPKSNPKTVCSFFRSIAGFPSSSPPVLIFPIVLLPGNRLRSTPLT